MPMTAQAFYCSEPNAPAAPSSWNKPDVPFCLSGYEYSGEHTCSQWQINSYIDEVNNYISDLNAFARDAANFASDAHEYAKCSANEIKTELPF